MTLAQGILVLIGLGVAVLVGSIMGHIHDQKVKQDEAAEAARENRERIARARLKKRLEAAEEECQKDAEATGVGFEVHDVPEFEADNYRWIFEGDHLRQYYQGDVLTSPDWFRENKIKENPLEDTWGRSIRFKQVIEGIKE